jgi:hypothetical protein
MNAYFTKSSRAVTIVAAVYTLVALAATPAGAQTTYQYDGNPFTLFSCGPHSSGSGTLLCATPGPNQNTSYLATDHVTATLVLDAPLSPNMPLQDVRSFPGFSLTMNDGRHTVTNLIAVGMFAEVATGPNGEITSWHLVINTGFPLNGGIATSNYTFVSDSGTLSCCDPTVHGDTALVFNNPGTWTTDTAPSGPSEAIADLIGIVGAPSTGLTAGQISSLTDKLNNALASIDAGLNKQAVNQLLAFINAVQSSVKNAKMSASTAQSLIDAANAIIAVL